MTATAPGYNPDQLHYWRAFQLPLTFETSKQAMYVLGKVVQGVPGLQPGDGQGRRGVAVPAAARRVLHGRAERRSATAVAKLKGKKIRSFGADIPKAFTAIGAVPVTVAPTDIYEALQHGTLDYSFINRGQHPAFKLVGGGQAALRPGDGDHRPQHHHEQAHLGAPAEGHPAGVPRPDPPRRRRTISPGSASSRRRRWPP